jgi:hypothetical protein
MPADLEAIPIQIEDQKEWWQATRDELARKDQEELFSEIIDSDKYLYNTVAVGITIEPDDADILIDNIKRLHGLLDTDLSWGPALDYIPELLNDKPPHLCNKVYRRLRQCGDAVYKDFGAYFLTAGDLSMNEEIQTLLISDTEADVAVGLKTAKQEYTDLPKDILNPVYTLFDQQTSLDTLIWFASRYLDNDYGFWRELVRLGILCPEKIPHILQCVRTEIDDDNLPGYIRLLRLAIEEGEIENPRISTLYTDFSHCTDQMVDFTVWLNCRDNIKVWQLAERVSEENPAYLKQLFDRIDEFDPPGRARFALTRAGRQQPALFADLVLRTFDEDNEWLYLELLRDAVGELFDDTEQHRDTVRDIYDFLEDRYDDEPFVRGLNRDRVGLENKDTYDETAALNHLSEFLLDLLSDRNYGDTLLERLDRYDALSDHFEELVEQKLEQKEHHPILTLLRKESPILALLEDNWASIPPAKRNDLRAGSGFTDFLSEVEFLIALNDRGIAFNVDVPLHHYQEGNEIRDADIVIDDDVYIDILQPEIWLPLSLSNQAQFIPNNAERKILSKFRDKFVNTKEMSSRPCFIALDIGQSEIDKEQVAAALHGSLQIQMTYEEETGDIVDERFTRDPDERLKGKHHFLDKHLNGVIWYRTELNKEEGTVKPVLKGNVIPNPEHQAGETNIEQCRDLASLIFPDQG